MTVSLKNKDGVLMEPTFVIGNPIMSSSVDLSLSPTNRISKSVNKYVSKFYWSNQWHMKTPIENTFEGSYIHIETSFLEESGTETLLSHDIPIKGEFLRKGLRILSFNNSGSLNDNLMEYEVLIH